MTTEPSGDFRHVALDDATHLFVHPTRKFKTTTVKAVAFATLDERAAWRSLLPSILRRGTRVHPSMMEISRALENLYGAALAFDVGKVGEQQVISWLLDVVGAAHLGDARSDRDDLLRDGLRLVGEVLLDPVLEDGAFRRDFFDQERTNLVHLIDARINDKAAYATSRMIEEMYPDSPYSLYEWGTTTSLTDLDPASLHCFWREQLVTTPIDIYVVGDLSVDAARDAVTTLLPEGRRASHQCPPGAARPPRNGSPRQVIEEQAVAQSKLVIGCRVDMQGIDETSFAALGLMNTLLGGGMHSRLFKQVREKQSLAYYASSSLDRIVGCLYIMCGIDAARFEQARDLSLEQIDVIGNDQFDDDELEKSRRAVLNRLRSIRDAAGALVGFHMGYRATGRHPTIADVIARIGSVGRGDVVAAARRIQPDTIYLMKGIDPPS